MLSADVDEALRCAQRITIYVDVQNRMEFKGLKFIDMLKLRHFELHFNPQYNSSGYVTPDLPPISERARLNRADLNRRYLSLTRTRCTL